MRTIALFGLGWLLALVLGSALPAQPPGAPPTKAEEYLSAFQITFEQGKYALAAEYLKAFLATEPTDPQLLDIERRFGPGVFQNLQAVPKWSDDPAADTAARETVKALTDRVRAATDKILRDPARIQRFVSNLGESYEERVYAINELRRAGDVVVPSLVDAYRRGPSDALRVGIHTAITQLDASTVAGWLAALDGLTPDQRYGVFSAILARPDVLNLPSFVETDFTPYLWYLAALPPEEAPALRQLVLNILAQFVPGEVRKQDPVAELVRIARTFHDHQARFRSAVNPAAGGGNVVLWTWDAPSEKLLRKNVPLAKAEEYYGLRYARWALERKPTYEPAQRLVLSLATDHAVQRGNFGELARTAPDVYQLLANTPTPLLADLLNEAMARKRTSLVLGYTQVLADRADKSVSSAPAAPVARPPLLVRALDYPDIRVQIAAANGLLRAPAHLTPQTRARIMTILKAAAGADTGMPPDHKGMALIVDPNRLRNDFLASLLRSLGYTVEPYTHGRDLLRRVGQGTDFDVVLVDRHVPDPMLNDFLSQLRSDLKAGGVPVAVIASPDRPQRPTLDGLLLRMAVLIAATETESVDIPAPYVPNIRNLTDDNERNRAANQQQRDTALRSLARTRMDRLTRVVNPSSLVLSSLQRAMLDLRVEQLTWAVLATQFPITPESSPATAASLAEFNQRMQLQPPVPPYDGIGMEGLLQRIERLQIDVDQNPLVKARFDTIRAAIDVNALNIDIGATRDEAAEALVAQVIRRYPGVTAIPLPYSRVGFEDDLEQVYANAGRAPRDPAEKLASARMAIGWLKLMATGAVPGFDIAAASTELRTALGSDELASDAIDALARVNTGEAQQALLNVALSPLRQAPIRLKAADATILHIQAHGKLIPQTQIAALSNLVANEANAEVKSKLAVLNGLLAFDADRYLNALQRFTPAEPPPPKAAPVPAPVPEPAPQPNP